MIARNVHFLSFFFASFVSSLLMVVGLRKSTAYSKWKQSIQEHVFIN